MEKKNLPSMEEYLNFVQSENQNAQDARWSHSVYYKWSHSVYHK
jgi:hypothetical protein